MQLCLSLLRRVKCSTRGCRLFGTCLWDVGRTIPVMAIVWIIFVVGCLGGTVDNFEAFAQSAAATGLKLGEVSEVFQLLQGFTLGIDLCVLIMVTFARGKLLEMCIEKVCKGRNTMACVSQYVLNGTQWLCFWLSWVAVVFTTIILIISVGLVVTFFISSILCTSGVSDAVLANVINQGLSSYTQIFKQPKIEIQDTAAAQFCRLWPTHGAQLGDSVVLSAVAILAQVNLTLASHKRCLQALWRVEMKQLQDQQITTWEDFWRAVAPPAVY